MNKTCTQRRAVEFSYLFALGIAFAADQVSAIDREIRQQSGQLEGGWKVECRPFLDGLDCFSPAVFRVDRCSSVDFADMTDRSRCGQANQQYCASDSHWTENPEVKFQVNFIRKNEFKDLPFDIMS